MTPGGWCCLLPLPIISYLPPHYKLNWSRTRPDGGPSFLISSSWQPGSSVHANGKYSLKHNSIVRGTESATHPSLEWSSSISCSLYIHGLLIIIKIPMMWSRMLKFPKSPQLQSSTMHDKTMETMLYLAWDSSTHFLTIFLIEIIKTHWNKHKNVGLWISSFQCLFYSEFKVCH